MARLYYLTSREGYTYLYQHHFPSPAIRLLQTRFLRQHALLCCAKLKNPSRHEPLSRGFLTLREPFDLFLIIVPFRDPTFVCVVSCISYAKSLTAALLQFKKTSRAELR